MLLNDDYEQLSSRALNTGLLGGAINLLASGGQGWGRAIANGLAGGLQGYAGTFQNAAEQKLLEQKLAQQQEEMRMKNEEFAWRKAQAEREAKAPLKVGNALLDPVTMKPIYTGAGASNYGQSPRIGVNPQTGKPEYVQFGDMGEAKWSGIAPTKDEIDRERHGLEVRKLIDTGVLPPNYSSEALQTPAGLPASPMPYSWSGPTPTDLREGTSPNMPDLRNPATPNLPPASRRKLAEKQAESDIDVAAAGKKIVVEDEAKSKVNYGQAAAQADEALRLVDELVNHPGFEAAVGASSKFDPRNYLPGTDATGFNVRLNQIKGKQFLQAFESLKGGGQITEVEGKKATEAIARMDTAVSETEFMQAAKDFKKVIKDGAERARAKANKNSSMDAGGWSAKRK